ncbi:MAG: MFS transporter [bacterium]|nr:MFS transporter [bacterium]
MKHVKYPGRRKISLTVIILGIVSFFATFSSDMIYPLLPIFLSLLGAGAIDLGLVEGIAEATASSLKILSGYLTDRVKKRKPFVLAGLSLSSTMRPLIGLATAWPSVLGLRFMDRTGNAIATSPQDALIVDVTDYELTGKAFGFQRAMEHGGSVAGPLTAVLLIRVFRFSLRKVFIFSIVPASLAISLLIFLIKEQGGSSERFSPEATLARQGHKRNGGLEREFKLFILTAITFTLGHPTDTFLLLRLHMAGFEAASSAILWSLFNIIKGVSTYIGGGTADRIAPKSMIIAGWLSSALIYLLFAMLESRGALIGVFLFYGVYFGFTEPAIRVFIRSFVNHELRGRAFGYYSGAIGFASLPASLLFGFLWQRLGYRYAFAAGIVFTLLGCAGLGMIKEPKKKS